MIGLEERTTKSGIHVHRIHYTADPMKRDEGVLNDLAEGMLGGRKGRAWKREMEIDWTVASGRGIYADAFDREIHVAKESLKPVSGVEIQRGYDFGLQPACAWCQLTADGVLLVLRELVTWTGRGAEVTRDSAWMGEQVSTISARKYAGFVFEDYADPAGWARAQTDSRTCVEELAKFGIIASPGLVSFEARRTVTGKALSTLRVGGRPAVVIDPSCRMIIEGFGGAYKFKQSGTGGNATLIYQADKNAHSHVMNALEYVIGSVFRSLGAATVDAPTEGEEDADSDDLYLSPNRAGLYY
jgi:hypothetical protein